MRKFIISAITCALAMSLAACSTNPVKETELTTALSTAETTASAETTQSAAPAVAVSANEKTVDAAYTGSFFSAEAESYYNLLTSDMSWRSDTTVGATLLDLDNDGSPELIVSNVNYPNDTVDHVKKIYHTKDNTLKFMYDFSSTSFDFTKSLGSGGKVAWWYSDSKTVVNEDMTIGNNDVSGFVLFDDIAPVADVKFLATGSYDEKSDRYICEVYTDGMLVSTDVTPNYSHVDGPPSFVNTEAWEMERFDWMNKNLDLNARYNLEPNFPEWTAETDIKPDLEKLVNAYCSNDTEYLCVKGEFGN